MKESVRMAEDRDKWRKYVHGVANPRIEDDQRTDLLKQISCFTKICGICCEYLHTNSENLAQIHAYHC